MPGPGGREGTSPRPGGSSQRLRVLATRLLAVACMARRGVLPPLCGRLSSSRGQRPTCTPPPPSPLQEPQIQLRSQVLFLAVLGPWPLEARRALVASRGGQWWAVPVLRTSPPGPMCIPPALAACSENPPTARRSPQVRWEGRASEPHARTWGGAPQVWRWQVQRPWGGDRPDLLRKGGGRGVRGLSRCVGLGVRAAHKPSLSTGPDIAKWHLPPRAGPWARDLSF